MATYNKSDAMIGAGILLVLFAVITFFTSLRFVGTGEVGVVTRFGKVTGRELNEGVHLVLPWLFERASIYDVKVQKQEADAAAASKDLQDVNSTVVLNYRIEPGRVSEIHQNIGPSYLQTVVEPAVQEVFKASSAQFTATELITQRTRVKDDAQRLLVERLGQYGIVVQDISITNFTFSPEFTQAIEKKQVAQQQAEQAVFEAQRAKEQANATIESAKGQAEAQRLQQATLTPLIIQKQWVGKWDGKLPQYVGGSEAGLFINLPTTQ